MNKAFFRLGVVLTVLYMASCSCPNKGVKTTASQKHENVLLFDDFNEGKYPNEKYWSLRKRGGSDSSEEHSESYDQAYLKDGNLVLVAEKVGGEYKTGGIETKDKFSFTYGTVEIRAKITHYPNGNFPAIWLMPQKSPYPSKNPQNGEIDIMEHIKQDSCIYQTVHTNYTYNLKIKDPLSHTKQVCDITEYHVYGVTWTPEEIIFTMDGRETLRYPNLHLENEAEMMQWPFVPEASFYLIVNMSLGSNTRERTWAGPIDDENLPAVMLVDWVRISSWGDE